MAKRKSAGLLENVKTIVYAGLIAIVIRSFLFEPFNIPSGSMIPTLLVGDFVFVSKFSYGYSRYSFPFSFPPFDGRVFGSLPARGDVAVFRFPRDTKIDYIKRIVGLPGDRIRVTNGMLVINDQTLERVPDGNCQDDERAASEGRRYVETLPEGLHHAICKFTDTDGMNNTDEYVVPPDHVFAMGDNRDNSQDSRYLNEVGYVPLANLVGKAQFVFFSVDGRYPWWQFWYWPVEVRWGRLPTIVR